MSTPQISAGTKLLSPKSDLPHKEPSETVVQSDYERDKLSTDVPMSDGEEPDGRDSTVGGGRSHDESHNLYRSSEDGHKRVCTNSVENADSDTDFVINTTTQDQTRRGQSQRSKINSTPKLADEDPKGKTDFEQTEYDGSDETSQSKPRDPSMKRNKLNRKKTSGQPSFDLKASQQSAEDSILRLLGKQPDVRLSSYYMEAVTDESGCGYNLRVLFDSNPRRENPDV